MLPLLVSVSMPSSRVPSGIVNWPATATNRGSPSFVLTDRYFEGDFSVRAARPPELAERGVLFQVDSSELDADSKTLLAELAGDIERLLEDESATGDAPLAERLADATERFEASHPRLTAIVGRIANALSNLGI